MTEGESQEAGCFFRHLERRLPESKDLREAISFPCASTTFTSCRTGRMFLYIGVTNDLGSRVGQHQEGGNPGFTRRYHLKRLVYFESYDRIADAIAREKQLKGWSRKKKIALIESLNPRWSDLSRE